MPPRGGSSLIALSWTHDRLAELGICDRSVHPRSAASARCTLLPAERRPVAGLGQSINADGGSNPRKVRLEPPTRAYGAVKRIQAAASYLGASVTGR